MSFGILVPGRFIESKDSTPIAVGAEGWWTLEALRGGRSVRSAEFKEPFPNMILDQGLDRFGSVNANQLYRAFWVGTGTTPPAPSDSSLVNGLPTSVSLASEGMTYGPAPDYWAAHEMVGTSTVGQFGNTNLTEIGVGHGSNAALLFSRALILDSNGNPTSFPLLSDEQLRATYQLRVYPPLNDAIYEVDVSGMRTATVRALRAGGGGWGVQSPTFGGSNASPLGTEATNFYQGGLSALTAISPQGSQVGSSSGGGITVNPYSSGSLKLGWRRSWGPMDGNSSSFRTHVCAHVCAAFQVEYDPPIAKSNIQSLYLDYEFSWERR